MINLKLDDRAFIFVSSSGIINLNNFPRIPSYLVIRTRHVSHIFKQDIFSKIHFYFDFCFMLDVLYISAYL